MQQQPLPMQTTVVETEPSREYDVKHRTMTLSSTARRLFDTRVQATPLTLTSTVASKRNCTSIVVMCSVRES